MAYPPQRGPYGAPQKKDRAPLIASMIFVAALLAGLGITGFVEPGFFLGDDDGGKGGSASGGSSSKGPGGLPGAAPPGGPEDGPADPTISGAPGDSSDDGSGDADSGDGSGDGEAFVAEFLDALNTLDSTKANDMYCPDAVGGMVDYVIKKDPQLTVDTTEASKYYLKVTLSGTLGGEPLRSGKLSVDIDGSGSPCVFTFTAA